MTLDLQLMHIDHLELWLTASIVKRVKQAIISHSRGKITIDWKSIMIYWKSFNIGRKSIIGQLHSNKVGINPKFGAIERQSNIIGFQSKVIDLGSMAIKLHFMFIDV